MGYFPTLLPYLWLILDLGTRVVGVGHRVVGALNVQGHVTFTQQANASRWFCGILMKGPGLLHMGITMLETVALNWV